MTKTKFNYYTKGKKKALSLIPGVKEEATVPA